MSDFFFDNSGRVPNFHGRRRRLIGAMVDPAIDVLLKLQGVTLIDKAIIPRRVLIIGIEVPGRNADIHNVLNRLQRSSKHSVELSIVPMADGLGKFANVERALSQVSIYDYEWLAIADDDIAFDSHMLDRLISLSEMANLLISQPAHRLSSFATYSVTLRKPLSFVRETHFVEIGPLTMFHRNVFPDVVPFPQSRWCYGIDLVWSEIARKKAFKIGIVDAAPVRHLRAVANSYNIDRARTEGENLIRTLNIPRTRAELLNFGNVIPTSHLKELSKKRARYGS